MSASWCKVASNLDSHPKIRRAGRNGREVFLFALRRNAEPNNKRRGFVPKEQLEPWYIADQLQMPEADAVDGLRRAASAGLLREEPDSWVIVGWDDREWGKFAKDGAERTADWRKRKAANVGDDSVTVRDGGDGCDGIDQRRGEEKRSEESIGGGLVFDFAKPVSEQVPVASPKPKREPSGPHQTAIAAFDAYYRAEHGGSKPTWNGKTTKLMASLVKAHGVEEVVKRIRILKTSPPKFPPAPWDMGAFSQHFDKLVTGKPEGLDYLMAVGRGDIA